MKRSFCFSLILGLLVVLGGAFQSSASFFTGLDIAKLLFVKFVDSEERVVSCDEGVEIANTIPRVGGNWKSAGSGTIYETFFTAQGTSSMSTYIDDDGFEVITNFYDEAKNFDVNGVYLDTLSEDVPMYYKITSAHFYIPNGSATDEYWIESRSKVVRKTTGNFEGKPVNFRWDYTRVESNDSSGGCSGMVGSPFGLLLVLPLLFARRRG